MGLYEVAVNYFRRLARPAPTVQPGQVIADEPARPLRKRERIRRAVKRAHGRVMRRINQPPRHGSNR